GLHHHIAPGDRRDRQIPGEQSGPDPARHDVLTRQEQPLDGRARAQELAFKAAWTVTEPVDFAGLVAGKVLGAQRGRELVEADGRASLRLEAIELLEQALGQALFVGLIVVAALFPRRPVPLGEALPGRERDDLDGAAARVAGLELWIFGPGE